MRTRTKKTSAVDRKERRNLLDFLIEVNNSTFTNILTIFLLGIVGNVLLDGYVARFISFTTMFFVVAFLGLLTVLYPARKHS